MDNNDEIYAAIRKADAAGDVDSVKKLAAYLKQPSQPAAVISRDADGNYIYDDTGGPPPEKPTSFLQGVENGIEKPLNNAALAVDAGARAIGLGGAIDSVNQFGHDYLGMAPSVQAAIDTQKQNNDASPTQGSALGQFTGELIGTAPAARLGPIGGGALQGALLTDKRDVAGVLGDAAMGGVAGKLGDLAVRGVARFIAPKVQALGDNVRKLIGEGVTSLTPGQVARDGTSAASRRLAAVEDRVSGNPVVGDMIAADRSAAEDQLNRAVANRALQKIGQKLPDAVPTGHKSVAHVADAMSAEYNDILPKMSGTVDQAFANRVAAIQQRAAIPPEYATQVKQVMTELGRAFTQNPGANGSFSGRTLRDASDRLDKLATTWGTNQNDPYLRQVGEVAGQLREQLHALARRQNPELADRLRNVDAGYAILVRLENAAKGAKGGVFSPGQLTTAVRTSDRSVRKRAVGRGEALLQDLSDAASQVMPSGTGSSGTSERLASSNLGKWALGAGQAIPYSLAKRDLSRQMTAGPAANYTAGLLRAGAPVAAHVVGATPSFVSSSLSK